MYLKCYPCIFWVLSIQRFKNLGHFQFQFKMGKFCFVFLSNFRKELGETRVKATYFSSLVAGMCPERVPGITRSTMTIQQANGPQVLRGKGGVHQLPPWPWITAHCMAPPACLIKLRGSVGDRPLVPGNVFTAVRPIWHCLVKLKRHKR